MSQSSPSLLDSLRRFRCQSKTAISHSTENVDLEKKLEPTENSTTVAASSETTFANSEATVANSEATVANSEATVASTENAAASELVKVINSRLELIVRPGRTKLAHQSLSDPISPVKENSMQNYQNDTNFVDELKNIPPGVTVHMVQDVSNNVHKPAHSISDSEEEQPESQQSTTVDDDDDDDDVICVSNPLRTCRPIVLSDDDDEDERSGSQGVDSNNVSVGDAVGDAELKPQVKEELEPEIFVVDDDSNSVEIIQSDSEASQEVKQHVEPEQQNGKRKASSKPAKTPGRKKRRKRIDSDSENEEHRNGARVFDSDADSDEEISNHLTEPKRKVLDFFNTAQDGELRLIASCTAKKIETIHSLRPFDGWVDLVTKFQTGKNVSTTMLNGAQQVIEARDAISSLMRRCEKIATRTENAIAAGAHSIACQPSILNPNMKLMPYQLVGLNWLNVMNSQNLSGILADEMGLGKTIQVIAFLAHLKETGQTTPNSPHLIVVPASTLENWSIEFEKWCPDLKVEQYYGSPEDRKWLRHTWLKNGFEDIEVILTTYSMVGSCYEERKMFRVVPLHYVIFDEAHMLKNMNTQRYENLFSINALHRTLLTGTPLQNNLLELMSLLVFVMPNMFEGKTDCLKYLFSKNNKQSLEDAPLFEQEQVQRAKRIMHPFVLRRLKSEALKDLPTKTTNIIECSLEAGQAEKYAELCEQARNEDGNQVNSMSIMMDLRRMANHPLTLRYLYEDETLKQMAESLSIEPTYKETDSSRILEDIQWMSDHQLHKLVKTYDCLAGYELADSILVRSGKFLKLDEILPGLKAGGHRVLIFSQFVFILDILEDYMRVREHSFLRLDGSTPVTERQDMIDTYNDDDSIFVFLLSTRAGGIGINLTAADTVIIHDVDFNPYNDKQAEDRCHRMGQTRPVQVMRFVSKGTVEEVILRVAKEKLHLEKEVTSFKDDEVAENINFAQLLRESLGIGEAS